MFWKVEMVKEIKTCLMPGFKVYEAIYLLVIVHNFETEK
jgi:hypothetical protein